MYVCMYIDWRIKAFHASYDGLWDMYVCVCLILIGESKLSMPLTTDYEICMYAYVWFWLESQCSPCLLWRIMSYWRMQNNCTTSDRLKRFFFQRCRLLLAVNVEKKHSQCKYATLYGCETSLDEQLFCIRQYGCVCLILIGESMLSMSRRTEYKICMYAYVYSCVIKYVEHMHMCLYIHTYILRYMICMYAYVYLCVMKGVKHMRMCLFIHTYIHTHVHIQVRTQQVVPAPRHQAR